MELAVDGVGKQQGLFTILAANMKKCHQHLGPWSMGALVFGLSILYEQHTKNNVADHIEGEEVTSRQDVAELLQDVKLAYAAYEAKPEDLWAKCAEMHVEVVMEQLSAEAFCPAYFIAIGHEQKCVLLVIRGTNQMADLFTDLNGSFEDNGCGCESHFGITKSAEALLEKTKNYLLGVLQKYNGYKVRIVGHSLGAGAGSIICYRITNDPLLKQEFKDTRIECCGIATPPVLTKELAMSCRDSITTVILDNDVIARASLANLEQLRKEVEECGWEGRVQEMVESKEFRLRAGIGVGILMGGPMALGAWALVASEALPDDIKKRASVAIQKFVDENNLSGTLSAVKKNIDQLGDHVSSKAKQIQNVLEEKRIKKLGLKRITSGTTSTKGSSDDAGTSSQEISIEESLGKLSISETTKPSPKLYCPGQVIQIVRCHGDDAASSFRVIRGKAGQRPRRIVLSKDMVKDHLLSTYQSVLEAHLDNLNKAGA